MRKARWLIAVPMLVFALLLPMVSVADSGKVVPGKEKLPPLDIMLGSMLMVGFHGTTLAPDDQFLKYHSLEETMRLAIEAGVDILLIGNNLHYIPDAHATAFATLSHLVKSGQVSSERIAQSYRRIKALSDCMR